MYYYRDVLLSAGHNYRDNATFNRKKIENRKKCTPLKEDSGVHYLKREG